MSPRSSTHALLAPGASSHAAYAPGAGERHPAARRDLPITPGLMPVTNLKQIQRMSELMGTPLPPAVVERLEAVKDDPAAVRAVGVEIATEIGQRMLDEGAPGLHFITMNRSTATLEVYENLSL